MTTIEFDAVTGRLRLPEPAFAGLVEPTGDATDLIAAGVVIDDRPHPLLAPGLEAARAPVCTLDIRVAGPAGVHLHRGWVAPEAAGFLLHSHDEVFEFLTTGPTFVPAAIARVLALGPRPHLTAEPIATSADLVDELFHPDGATRDPAVAVLLEATGAAGPNGSVAHLWRASYTRMSWVGAGDEPAGRALVLFDTSAGLLIAEPDAHDADQARWSAISATQVWRAIVLLLPGDDELAQPPGDPR